MVHDEWQQELAGCSASNGYRVWTGLRVDDRLVLWHANRSRQPAA